MLTINQALKLKPVFILSYDKSQGLLDDNDKEIIGCDNEYLADLTIQYHSIVDDACLSFTIECLVQEYDGNISIEQMNTCDDTHSVYSENIETLPCGQTYIWQDVSCIALHDKLKNLIESQPIYNVPDNFINESW